MMTPGPTCCHYYCTAYQTITPSVQVPASVLESECSTQYVILQHRSSSHPRYTLTTERRSCILPAGLQPHQLTVTEPFSLSGDGGNREGHSATWLATPSWSVHHNGDMYGHSRITVANRTHALFEWIPNTGAEWITGDAVWVLNANSEIDRTRVKHV